MFSLESPHGGDSNEYTKYTIFYIKKKITLNYPKSAAMKFFSKGLKNEFETAVVNQPSVFESLKFYCIWEKAADSIFHPSHLFTDVTSFCDFFPFIYCGQSLEGNGGSSCSLLSSINKVILLDDKVQYILYSYWAYNVESTLNKYVCLLDYLTKLNYVK